MKKIELPSELVSCMASGKTDTFVFVNDLYGWEKEENTLPGVDFIHAYDGNSLRGKITEEVFGPHCCTLRVGNGLAAKRHTGETSKSIMLGELPLFKDFPVVIMTQNESLTAFAPVCNNKLELALFLAVVQEESEKRKTAAGEDNYSWNEVAHDMVSLAKFLYLNNPNKEPSLFDDVD